MINIKTKGRRLAAILGLGISAVTWGGSVSAAECTYTVTNSWSSGFTGAITITNNGNNTINGWNLNWAYNKNSISNAWNAQLSGAYSASNMSWNATISPGQSVSFGFQGDANGGKIETPVIFGDVCNSAQPPASSSSLSSAAEASSSSSTAEQSSSSSVTEQCIEMCKWYQDAARPLCENQSSGWGYENGQSCIGRSTCESQSGNGGVISDCPASSSSIPPVVSSSSSTSSYLPASSSSISSSSIVPSSSSSISSSSVAPASSSSISSSSEPPISSSSSFSSSSLSLASSSSYSSAVSSELPASSSSASSETKASSSYSSDIGVISSSSSSTVSSAVSSAATDDSLVLYNGESKPFSAASGWDANGSTIAESDADPASGTNHLRLELNVSGWWAAGAYVPNNWSTIDLSNALSVTFKAKANTATGLSLWLWDADENQSSSGAPVQAGTEYQQYTIALSDISDGVSLNAISVFVFASSGLEEGEAIVDIDDIALVMGGASSSESSSSSSISNTQHIIYDGETKLFADATAWDANGSSMVDSTAEPASGTNHLRATLVIEDWWGAAAYVPGNWSPVDWSNIDFLRFKAKADTPMSISVGLFDSSENQTESPVVVSLGTDYQEYAISMEDIALGVAIDSINTVVFAGSGIASGTHTVDIDDIIVEIDNSSAQPTPTPEPIDWKTEVDPVNPSTDGKKLKGVYVVDKDYLMVHFVDGEVVFHEDTTGECAYEFCNEADANTVVTYGEPLNTTAASSPWQWHITSTDDDAYGSQGQAPDAAHRKSKLNGMAQLQWSGNDFVYEPTMEHWVYLKLPTSMEPGKTYSLQIGGATNTDIDHWTFTYDIFNSPTEALHVNLAGYHPQAAIQAADLYLWMGDGGGRDYSEFEGNRVYLYNVETDTAEEVGEVEFWQKSASEAQQYNFTRTDVWNVDFTGDYAPGTYRLAVEGVGSSNDFTIGAEALQDPFKVSALGYFYMRIGQDNLDMTPVPRRPLWIPGQSPSDTRILITDMDPYHPDWTAAGGDRWDQPQFFADYVKPGAPENTTATGGHSDAADWDRHLGHVSNIYDMLLPYILTNGAIGSDSLGIAESGNGVPDIIDEARNEVDFWLSLRFNGGYSHGLTNPDSSSHILYQADNTTVAAWANAANAAMIASAYRIANQPALADHYLAEAQEAWTYASNSSDLELENSQEVGGGDMTGRDFRIMAAAWLYHLTGNTAFEDVVEADSLVTSSTSEFLTSERNQLYALAAYLTTDKPIHYPPLRDNMRAAVIYQAKTKETRYMGSRPSRRSTDNDQGYFHTAQFVTRSILAHAVSTKASDRQHFEQALQLEADWGLGRNPSNMIQMTTATTALADMRSVENCYTSGRNDGTPGLHPGHTPYLNIDDWGSMVMASPSWMSEKLYPKASGWPRGEVYFNTRWVWAHSEFTPRQTMRGKMALYGYLLGIKQGGTIIDDNTDPDPVVTGPTAEVHYFGRFDTTNPETPRCAWSNCGAGVRFEGNTLDVNLSGAGKISFQVILDGKLHSTITTSGSAWNSSANIESYRLVENAGPGEHDVQMYRNPEGVFGATTFHGFSVTNGGLIESPYPFSRKIEIIGDSISAGYGNAGCPWAPENEIGSAAWGPLAARALDATVNVIAVSGNGMVTSYGGETENQMPELYKYAIPGDTQTLWEYSDYIPDVVVVNLGTNDFASSHNGMDRSVYINTYKEFVSKLRSNYPQAYILLATNSTYDSFSDELDEVIADLGDSNVEKINLGITNWSGCDGHPDLSAHQAMAGTLITHLEAKLGW